jgi:hypothetical protein
MTFNDEQFAALAKYESYFTDAVNANWCRYPGRAALEEVHKILHDATGDNRRPNFTCGPCLLSLMKDTGKKYFKDKAERIAAQNETKAVELTEKKARTRKKVKVETEAE